MLKRAGAVVRLRKVDVEDVEMCGYSVAVFRGKLICIPIQNEKLPVVFITSVYWPETDQGSVDLLQWDCCGEVRDLILQVLEIGVTSGGDFEFLTGKLYEVAGVQFFEPTYLEIADVILCRQRGKHGELLRWYEKQFEKPRGVELLWKSGAEEIVCVGVSLETLSREVRKKLSDYIA